jgi:hypothetical protein
MSSPVDDYSTDLDAVANTLITLSVVFLHHQTIHRRSSSLAAHSILTTMFEALSWVFCFDVSNFCRHFLMFPSRFRPPGGPPVAPGQALLRRLVPAMMPRLPLLSFKPTRSSVATALMPSWSHIALLRAMHHTCETLHAMRWTA